MHCRQLILSLNLAMQLKFYFIARYALPILLLIIFVSGCSCPVEEYHNENIYAVTATGTTMLSNGNNAGAKLTGIFNANTRSLMYHVDWKNLSSQPTGGGLYLIDNHPAETTRILSWNFPQGQPISATWHSTIILDSLQTNYLLNGQLHFIITSLQHNKGEVTGNLKASLK